MADFPINILFKTSTIADGNMSFRIGDIEESLYNRKQFLLTNNIEFQNHVCMKCDHGEEIIVVNYGTKEIGATTQEEMLLAEVLITREKGLALMLLTADCLPVSFYDPVTKTIALAHCSRETISKMLPQNTVKYFQEYFEVIPSNLRIQIGPYIHTDSYSFPLPQPNLSPTIKPFIKRTGAHVCVDLASACIQQLTQLGIPLENISVSDIDTATSPKYYSHYQSKKQNAPEGRLATILLLS